MLQYERIHILEGIDVNRMSNRSKECDLFSPVRLSALSLQWL